MAGLADFDFEGLTREIKLPNGVMLVVRGLALSDVTRIFRAHADDIETMFSSFSQDKDAIVPTGDPKYAQTAVATKFGGELLSNFPMVAADIIAYAADEPTLAHKARKLPFPIQLEALQAIAELTFTEEDALKKVAEIVIQMVAKTTATLSDLNQQQIGLLQSEGK